MSATPSSFVRPLALVALLFSAAGAGATTVQPTVLQDLGGSTTVIASSGHRAIGDGSNADGSQNYALLWDLRHPGAAPTVLATHPGYSGGFSVERAISDRFAAGQEVFANADGTTTFRTVVWDLDHPARLPVVLNSGGFASTAPFVMQGALIAGGGVTADGTLSGLLWDLRHPNAAPRVLAANAQLVAIASGYVIGVVFGQNQDGSTSSSIALFDVNDLDRAPKSLNAGDGQVPFGANGRYVGGGDTFNGVPLLWDLKKPKAAPRVITDPAGGFIIGVGEEYAVGQDGAGLGFAIRIGEPQRPSITLGAGGGPSSIAFGSDGNIAVGYVAGQDGLTHPAFWRLEGDDDRDCD